MAGWYPTVRGLPGLKWWAVTTQWNAQIPPTVEGDPWRPALFGKRAMGLSLVNCHPPCCAVAKGDAGVTSPGAGLAMVWGTSCCPCNRGKAS